MAALNVAVLHVRNFRPANSGFQHELDVLNASTLKELGRLGHHGSLFAAAELAENQAQQIVDSFDAVIIMGGEDVHPQLYRGSRHYPGAGDHELAADLAQIAAIRHAIATATPLLGICRGLQLINVALGGTLRQHLDPAAAHRATAPDPFVNTRLNWVSDELAEDLSAAQAHKCTHHQAIAALAAGLEIVARTGDGLIEAVVHDSAPLTAVQWHPEHPQTAATQLRALLRRLETQHALRAAASHEASLNRGPAAQLGEVVA